MDPDDSYMPDPDSPWGPRGPQWMPNPDDPGGGGPTSRDVLSTETILATGAGLDALMEVGDTGIRLLVLPR
jgi:hypothetical protein